MRDFINGACDIFSTAIYFEEAHIKKNNSEVHTNEKRYSFPH